MTSRILLVAVAAFVALAGCSDNGPVASGDNTPLLKDDNGKQPYIVVFNSSVTASRVPEVANDMARLHAAEMGHQYETVIRGFAARMTPAQADALSQDPRVAWVQEDRMISLGKPSGGGKPARSTQKVPWGITYVVDQPLPNLTGEVRAWIIDTGIDIDHPDLNVDLGRSRNFSQFGTGFDDGNGHGTHVAGTIGAINNTIGVVGVAPNTPVVAIRVLGANGSGYTSDVIAGVNWVAANAATGDVANISLGGPVDAAMDAAVVALGAAGVKVAMAAGNEYEDANLHSPGRANGVNLYTVSAVNSSGCIASFSNVGNPPVDFAAPGVNVLSTWRGGGTNTISGTSMATPHVAGLLVLNSLNSRGTATCDRDATPDPLAHR